LGDLVIDFDITNRVNHPILQSSNLSTITQSPSH